MQKDYNFNEKGCLFLKDVYPIEIINNINQEIKEYMNNNNIYGHLQKKNDVEEKLFFVNNTYNSLNSFHKMQYYYLPVIDNRGSHNRTTDLGMIDIFNAQKIFPNIFTYIDINIILTILQKITGISWKLDRTNIQICNNVITPNSFHFENVNKCIKYTIYLSDILNNDDGPPMYIEKTHNDKTNIKNECIKTFLGKKGDVLISFQNGIHRKLPQKNKISGFLVFNFIPLGKIGI